MPCLAPGLDGRGDAEDLVFADQVSDTRGHDQGLERSHPTAADTRDQLLGENADDRTAQLGANLVLLIGRKHVDNTVDRAGGTTGMQRTEHDVARFRSGDGSLDRFQVAQLTDENHIGVLSQGAANGLGKRGDIDTDFALIDRRFAVVVIKLDRVFDRDNVMIDCRVQIIDHRGQRS